jgi:hypothetical protein
MAEVVRGFQVQAAIGTEPVYGTEVAATRKLRYISDSLTKAYEPIPNEALLGNAATGPSDQGIATVTGDLVTDWDYTLIDLLFSRFFGTHTVEIGDDTYTLQDMLDDVGMTVVIAKRVDEWVFKGAKISKLTLSGAPGEVMQCTWEMFPSDRIFGSVLNTQAVIDALAAPAVPRVLFHHSAGGIWIGDQVDILTSADAVKINSWELVIDRHLEQFHANAQNPEQAREAEFLTVELSIELPLYQDNFFIAAYDTHTPLQCRAAWTRNAAVKTIRIPNMFVTECKAEVGGPGLVPHAVTFSCHHDEANANASADMSFSEVLRLFEA